MGLQARIPLGMAIRLAIAATIASACGSNSEPPPTVAGGPVATVTIPVDSIHLVVPVTFQRSARLAAADGSPLTRGIVWSSAAPHVASVSPSGLVTARDGGVAIITATSEGRAATVVAVAHVVRPTREYREW